MKTSMTGTFEFSKISISLTVRQLLDMIESHEDELDIPAYQLKGSENFSVEIAA